MMRRMIFAVVGSIALVMGFSSCAKSTGLKGISAYQAYDRPAKLPSDPAAVKVKVSLSKQRVYVMEGNEMLLVMPVSVGTAKSPTPTGNFRINSKSQTPGSFVRLCDRWEDLPQSESWQCASGLEIQRITVAVLV